MRAPTWAANQGDVADRSEHLLRVVRRAMADDFARVMDLRVGPVLRAAWDAAQEVVTDPPSRTHIDGRVRAWDDLGVHDRKEVLARLSRWCRTALAGIGESNRATPPGPRPTRVRKPAPARRSAEVAAPATGDVRDQSIRTLPGCGPATAARLEERAWVTLEDLALVSPSGYIDHRRRAPPSAWRDGEHVTFEARPRGLRQGYFGGRYLASLELELSDGDSIANVTARWFSPMGGLAQWTKVESLCVSGKVQLINGRTFVVHPQLRADASGLPAIAVKYPAVEGVAAAVVAKLVREAARRIAAADLPDVLPPELRAEHDLIPRTSALRLLHDPPADLDEDALGACVEGRSPAHRRLAFEEFLFLQLSVLQQRALYRDQACAVAVDRAAWDQQRLRTAVPFPPTGAQTRVISELATAMAGPLPMMRLLQGDVGAGKTFVAFAAALATAAAGGQAAIMAPTEILAAQHHRTLAPWCERAGLRVGLVTGALRSGVRESVVALAGAGAIDILVGTHALLTADVGFQRLGLVVVDEQHRFGVEQRARLRAKGDRPHLLVMTATPIPRTMALVAYGELDVSILDELPPGREPAATEVFAGAGGLTDARARIVARVREGGQAFVVCPLVEASEAMAVSDVEATAAAFRRELPDQAVAVVHGRMPSREKDAAMESLRRGEVRVLVATTVIEVGVDVPSVRTILVEHAERFGLAQLHQLRGRVGRDGGASLCVLHTASAPGSEAAERLGVLVREHDGFTVAEHDLALRGPGEVFGLRQAGAPRIPVGGATTTVLLDQARRAAETLLAGGSAPDLPWMIELQRRRAGRTVVGEA